MLQLAFSSCDNEIESEACDAHTNQRSDIKWRWEDTHHSRVDDWTDEKSLGMVVYLYTDARANEHTRSPVSSERRAEQSEDQMMRNLVRVYWHLAN